MDETYKNYKEAVELLQSFFKKAQQPQMDAELKSPNVIVEPAEPLIQSAIQLLKRKDPNFFIGIRKIIVHTEPHYGHVSSGPKEDPSVIYINLNKINSSLSKQLIEEIATF